VPDKFTPLRAGLRWARPLAIAIVDAQLEAGHPGELVIARAGDAIAGARLAGLIDARQGSAHPGDLLVGVAAAHGANLELAAAVGDHRRGGGRALVVVIGSPVERRAIERELRTDRDVGISVMLMVDSLDGADLVRVRRRVANMILSRGEGLRRTHPSLKLYPSLTADIVHQLQHRTAVRMALRAALVADADNSAVAMKATQARLAADTAGMADAPLDPKTVGLVAALGLLPLAWRSGAGRLTGLVPFTRIAVRGGIAYSVTRLVGIGAQRVAKLGRAPHQEER
jgi:hypothetical protein